MKNILISLSIAAMITVLFITPSMSNNGKDSWEGINPSQNISVGDVIYRRSEKTKNSDSTEIWNSIAYIYKGCDGKSIIISIEQTYLAAGANFAKNDLPPKVITLPFNSKNQALLKTETLKESSPNEEVLITSTGDFFRLKAESYSGK